MTESGSRSSKLTEQIDSARLRLDDEIAQTIDKIITILTVLHHELAEFDNSRLVDESYRAQLVAQITDYERALKHVYEASGMYDRSIARPTQRPPSRVTSEMD